MMNKTEYISEQKTTPDSEKLKLIEKETLEKINDFIDDNENI